MKLHTLRTSRRHFYICMVSLHLTRKISKKVFAVCAHAIPWFRPQIPLRSRETQNIWHSDAAAQGRSRPSAAGGGCLLDPIVLSKSAIATILPLCSCVIISSFLSPEVIDYPNRKAT
ncbi:hypothetical protein BDQ94DRAFT_184541 [Aspergillus welwitschiae]|uniref:Uncharacterized protein n=1 Tax=Aspergillus welwitschiae TaxID=1341132 RepID=A0A3F3PKQ0_9EURO|nr:hypothetical protein BDQ94DRAFT_184541 [Aspergillus welwitschiae]RDH27504.1 hypothetical protein BDQ94DRAFT_184541 [Aspergillus welwitschiae]